MESLFTICIYVYIYMWNEIMHGETQENSTAIELIQKKNAMDKGPHKEWQNVSCFISLASRTPLRMIFHISSFESLDRFQLRIELLGGCWTWVMTLIYSVESDINVFGILVCVLVLEYGICIPKLFTAHVSDMSCICI